MEGAREFVLSCSYGALAGTLVGAATLAFSEKPGDNLNNIARGASLGLYAGILLGLYVVYGVPSQPSEEDLYVDADAWLKGTAHRNEPKAFIYPLISERGLEGASARVQLVSF